MRGVLRGRKEVLMKQRVSIAMLGLLLLLAASNCQSGESGNEILEPTVTPIPFTVIQPTATPSREQPVDEGQPAALEPAATPTAGLEPTSTPTLPAPSGLLNVPQVGGETGQVWNLADLRYGLHPTHLRLVLEMQESGTATPKYRVVEVSNAETPFPGSSDVDWGEARIDILVSDLYARDVSLDEMLPILFPDDPVILRIGQYPTVDDAILGLSIGLKTPVKYEVYELAEPVRIVVDIFYP